MSTPESDARAQPQPAPILTERLRLAPATVATLEAELRGGRDGLEKELGCRVPESWPPEHYGEPVLHYTLARLLENPEQNGWWMHYICLRDPEGRPTEVVGTCGYKGSPAGGTVEIGYSVLPEFRRRGFATEAARGLCRRAFDCPEVRCVLAHTLPDLEPSIGVLKKAGFRLLGKGFEPGAILFELKREDFGDAAAPDQAG